MTDPTPEELAALVNAVLRTPEELAAFVDKAAFVNKVLTIDTSDREDPDA